jgi:hypothetical protein
MDKYVHTAVFGRSTGLAGPEGGTLFGSIRLASCRQGSDLLPRTTPNPAVGVLYATIPQFVIEREIPGAGSLTQAQIREVSLRSLGALKDIGPQIQWLHSYVTEDKVYCVYLAPDEETIREHARRTNIPANRISAVRRLIDPKNLN